MGHPLWDDRVRSPLPRPHDLSSLTHIFSQRSISLVFGTLYPQFNPGQLGAVFATMSIGCLIGFFTNFWQEKLYR